VPVRPGPRPGEDIGATLGRIVPDYDLLSELIALRTRAAQHPSDANLRLYQDARRALDTMDQIRDNNREILGAIDDVARSLDGLASEFGQALPSRNVFLSEDAREDLVQQSLRAAGRQLADAIDQDIWRRMSAANEPVSVPVIFGELSDDPHPDLAFHPSAFGFAMEGLPNPDPVSTISGTITVVEPEEPVVPPRPLVRALRVRP